jgi:methyl-accepting chemotaxis protein
MKILAKLLIGFLAVALICAVVGLVGVTQLQSMEKSVTTLSSRALPAVISLNSIYENMLKIKNAIRSLAIQEGLGDEVFTKRQYDNIEKARNAYKPELEKHRGMPKTQEEERLFKEFDALVTKAAAYNNELIASNEKARQATGPTRT